MDFRPFRLPLRLPARAPSAPTPAAQGRRFFLAAAVFLAGSGPGVCATPLARGDATWQRARTLWITRPDAQEAVRCTYWAEGRLVPEGVRELEHIFRDVSENVLHPISPALLHLNFAMQAALSSVLRARPMVLFSGYRTARTNRRVGGVEHDTHCRGLADDFIHPGLSFSDNVRLARLFQVGGLGIYPARGSLHKDVAAFRSWVQEDPQAGAVRAISPAEAR